MKTSKSPRRVLQVAYEAACRALPAHRHKFSLKRFTQPQLPAYLILKEFSRLDYRGLAAHLADHPDLIDLKAVPTSPPSRRPRSGSRRRPPAAGCSTPCSTGR